MDVIISADDIVIGFLGGALIGLIPAVLFTPKNREGDPSNR